MKPTLATKDTSMEITPAVRRYRRRKLFIWLGVAVALHTALLLAFFLTPRMRLKWTPPPEDWVPVVSLPKPEPVPSPLPEKPAGAAQSPAQVGVPSKPAKHSIAKPKRPPHAQPSTQDQPQRSI